MGAGGEGEGCWGVEQMCVVVTVWGSVGMFVV